MTNESVEATVSAALRAHADQWHASGDAHQRTLARSAELRAARRRHGVGVVAAIAVAAAVVVVGAGLSARVPAERQPSSQSSALSLAAMPEAPLSPRENHVQVLAGSRLFVWGGDGNDGEQNVAMPGTSRETFSDGALFDRDSQTWSAVSSGPLGARALAAAVWTGREVLVVGGREGNVPRPDAAAYDVATDRWSDLPAAPNCPTSAALVGGRVVTAGGCGRGSDVFSMFDLGTRTWERVATPADRWSPDEPVIDVVPFGEGVLITGANGTVVGFDPDSGRWSRMAAAPQGDEGLVPVAYAGNERDGLLAMSLASHDTGDVATVWSLDDNGSWQPIASTPHAHSAMAPHPVMVDGSLLYGTATGVCVLAVAATTVTCAEGNEAEEQPARTGTRFTVADQWGAIGTTVFAWGGRTPPVGDGYWAPSATGVSITLP